MDNRQSLPFGELLREFLSQPGLSLKDLKRIARSRGIFLCVQSKENIIPELVKTGISTVEFNFIQGCIQRREENPKISTKTISAVPQGASLVEALEEQPSVRDLIDTKFESFEVNGDPKFIAVDGDPDHLSMSFNITRTDLSKSLQKSVSEFEASISLTKNPGTNEIIISTTHTAPETRRIATKIANHAVSMLKDAGAIDAKTELTSIKFNDFDNKSRAKFLLSLAQGPFLQLAVFQSIHDCGVAPSDKDSYPEDIAWLEEHIRLLHLQGEQLENINFLKDEKIADYVEIYRIEGSYSVTYQNYSGNCRILFEFADYTRGIRDGELIVSIDKLDMALAASLQLPSKVQSFKVKEAIVNAIEPMKITLHRKHRRQSTEKI